METTGRLAATDQREHTGRNRPGDSIGVFDSGVGGLTVVRELNRVLPHESILYYGDNLHVPYGGRPLGEVRGFALDIVDYLADSGVKMVIVGCNISSAVALGPARRFYSKLPIVGLIDAGARSAVRAHNRGPIGVIATEGTVATHKYTETIQAAREIGYKMYEIRSSAERPRSQLTAKR